MICVQRSTMFLFLYTSFLLLVCCTSLPVSSPISSDDLNSEAFARRNYFMVGGEYVFDSKVNGTVKVGQMYVEKLTPQLSFGARAQKFPIVFIHGGSQTGSNWLQKSDGGVGWATRFLQQGYTLYLVDMPARGRSPWWPNSGVPVNISTAEFWEQYYTAPEKYNLFPQAKLHTQWNGSGTIGEPVFDTYYSAVVQQVSNPAYQQTLMQKAGAALLDKIGEAILLGHSAGGVPLWALADARPKAVKAIIAMEASGPPFHDPIFPNIAFPSLGLTDIPLNYDPPLPNGSTLLETTVVPSGGEPDELQNCTMQVVPARQLPNLKEIPVLFTTAEASFHAVYDRCTVLYLKQVGVSVEWVRLQDVGIRGNGHFHFLEKNSDEIQQFLASWLEKTIG